MKLLWITKHLGDTPRPIRRLSAIQKSERTTTFQKFLAMQKLKKAALVLIAGSLTQAEVADLGEIFRQVDKQGDGVMTLTELDDAISRGKFRNHGMWTLRATRDWLKICSCFEIIQVTSRPTFKSNSK